MTQLTHPNSLHVRAARGWIELGNAAEARLELDRIHPEFSRHPDVLDLKWQLAAKARAWEECIDLASALTQSAPGRANGWIHLAFALHEIKRTREAYDHLKDVLLRFKDEPVIPYNLACYSCRMDRLDEARMWLQQAMVVGNAQQIKSMALSDPDLEALWDELQRWNFS
jgi:predicted Zn-dependent protease